MGRRSWMDGLSVVVEEGDPMPDFYFDDIREIVVRVALRKLEKDSNMCKLAGGELVYRPA
jgi:hypothetical protein